MVLIVLDGKAFLTFAARARHAENATNIALAIVQVVEYENPTIASIAGDSEIPLSDLRVMQDGNHGGLLQSQERMVGGQVMAKLESKRPTRISAII